MKYGIIPVLLFSKMCLKLLNIPINNSFSSLVKQLLLQFVAILHRSISLLGSKTRLFF